MPYAGGEDKAAVRIHTGSEYLGGNMNQQTPYSQCQPHTGRFVCFACLIFLLSLVLLILPALAGQEGFDTQTLMIYIVGSDLESGGGAATRDISEMLKSRVNPDKIKVLVMAGGTTKWHSPIIPKDGLSIFEIRKNKPALVHSLPDQSMGNPESLSAFLQFAYDNYPADSYSLVLWDHGGGPMIGFGMDTRFQGDMLSLEELRQALGNSPFGSGQKLEWIGFDACLMSSVEVAALAAPYARYMIASQETLPGEGWNYLFLRELQTTSLTGPEAAKAIIGSTMDYYEAAAQKTPHRKDMLTLSCLDLQQIGPLEAALDSLFSQMDEALFQGNYPILAKNRDDVKAFGRFGTSEEFDLIDLADLADQMQLLYPEQAEGVSAAVRQMVILNQTNQPQSNGISLYYPFNNKKNYEKAWQYTYPNFQFAPQYTRFMQHFGENLLSKSKVDWAGSKALQPVYDQQKDSYYLQLTPEQAATYARGYFYILSREEGEYYNFLTTSSNVTLDENNRLKANFDGNALLLRDKKKQVSVIPFINEREAFEGIGRYQSAVILYSSSSMALDSKSEVVRLQFEVDKINKTAQLVGAIRIPDKNQTFHGKQDINLEEWGSMLVGYSGYYITRDENGDLLPFNQWEDSGGFWGTLLEIGPELEVVYDSVNQTGDELYCIITMEDVYGSRFTSELMPIKPDQGAAPPLPTSTPEPPPPNTWQPKVISLDPDSPEEQLLFEGSKVKVSVTGIEGILYSYKPDLISINVLLKIVNKNDFPVSIDARQIVINQSNIYPRSVVLYPPQEGEDPSIMEARLDFYTSILVESNIRQINNIDFILSVKKEGELFDTLAESQPLSIRLTKPFPQEELPQKGFGQPLLTHQEHDVLLEFGPAYFDGDALKIDYHLFNQSDLFDDFSLEDITMNDTYVHIRENIGQVRKGTNVYRSLHYGSWTLEPNRVFFPMELEFNILYSRKDFTREQSKVYEKISQRFSVPITGGPAQTAPDEGKELYHQNGIRIVRMDFDPTGQTFKVENNTDTRIRLFISENTPGYSNTSYSMMFAIMDLMQGKHIYVRSSYSGEVPYLSLDPVVAIFNVVDNVREKLLFTTPEITLNR